jgi:diguanylate cyclase (GGDEF)-like protein
MDNIKKQLKSNFFNEETVLGFIAWGPFLFIPSAVLLLTFLLVTTSNIQFEKTLTKLEKDLHKSHREAMKLKVDSVVNNIIYKKSIIKENLKTRVQKRVTDAFKISRGIYEKYKDTKTKKEIQEMIVSALRPLRWNGGESFIWIMDYEGRFYLAPDYLRALEGKTIIDFKDNAGQEIIKNEISICKSEGEGFLWDTFTKPNKDLKKQYKQLAYVKAFGVYDWYLGSAEYLDTARKKDDKALLKSIFSVDEMAAQHIIVAKLDGELLVDRDAPHLIGANLLKSKNKTIVEVFKNTLLMLKERDLGYITYEWVNGTTKQTERKYSYFHLVPNTDWLVACGYFESDIKNIITKKSVSMYENQQIKLIHLLIGGLTLLFVSLLISYYVSKYIKKIYLRYKDEVSKKTAELETLNATLEYKVRHRTHDLEKITKKLKHLARTDSLTKIHNRYSIMKILSQELNRSRRHAIPLSILMFDIDHFKKINDKFGHGVGDKALFDIAQVVKNTLRDIDYIGRYGGEEFLVIMPETTLLEAQVIANRLKDKIAQHDFAHIGHLTVSIGLVEVDKDEILDTILKKVDDLMYRSKESGRNTLTT